MARLNLQEWAAVAEIAGTIAVVVSLGFVIHSVNQNTEAIQNVNQNHVYDRLDSLNADIAASPELALVYAEKNYRIEGMTAIDAQYFASMRRELNQWEQYFEWHKRDLLDERDWTNWNTYYSVLFERSFPESWWRSIRVYYNSADGGDFAIHVDRVYESISEE